MCSQDLKWIVATDARAPFARAATRQRPTRLGPPALPKPRDDGNEDLYMN
jgi:hypothetical protein